MNDRAAIRILSAGAPKSGVRLCAEAWSKETATPVDIEFATAPVIKERVEGGTAAADIIVAPAAAIHAFAEAGHIASASTLSIGSIAAGVVVRDGATEPDLSSAEALRADLLAADCIVYNKASSGQYIESMIDRLGIADEVAEKTVRVPNGAAVMEHLAADGRDRAIGFGQVTEIRLHEHIGVHLVGPLPSAIGKTTTYAAGLSAVAPDNESATVLLAFMDSDTGKAIFAATGVE